MIKAYFAMVKIFKNPLSLFVTYLGILIVRLISVIGISLDKVFFPKLKSQKIVKPIIVVGNPRSGTTFLQRFLVDQKIGVGMKLYKLIFPSILIQKIISPILPLIEKISPARFHKSAAHETNLTAVETDDPAFLFRYFDGFFVYGFFLSWAEADFKNEFDPTLRNTSNRDFAWLTEIWKRNLLVENEKQVVSKLFSLGIRLPEFIKYFPDAKILYTLRNPLETVPSAMSLVIGVLDAKYGFWNLPEAKRNFFIERLYQALLELSMRFFNDYKSNKIPNENLFVVEYTRLMTDFENVMNEIVQFAGIDLTNELKENIKKTDAKQKAFKSGHIYDLAKFGLSRERIQSDYAAIYNEFFKD